MTSIIKFNNNNESSITYCILHKYLQIRLTKRMMIICVYFSNTRTENYNKLVMKRTVRSDKEIP